MQTVHTICFLMAVAGGCLAMAMPQRHRRDVSELSSSFLAPAEPQVQVQPSESAKGYVYRTVRQRRFRLRQRRDVSHLPLEYLPPVALPPLPSRDYLPPVEQQAASLPSVLKPVLDYLPPVAPKLNNDYLPPAAPAIKQALKEQPPETTTAIVVEETTTTTTTTEAPAPTTEAVTAETQPATELAELKSQPEPVESAVLEADGYHYRTPAVIPDLSPLPEPETPRPQPEPEQESEPEPEPEPEAEAEVQVEELKVAKELPATAAVGEYLPPLVDNGVVAEGPENDESAALLDDGYHYRAIRRLRF